ncbi:MAG: CDP-diacylglycerol--serine O-phosphatidyltransferase [Acidobacteria bacterium]|nr:CDP-diacylglycerol--serine O-phosphatidyltransferase [Acidobacteriota bacterium]
MRRGIYILPSIFTVGTLVCGYYAILSTLKGSQLVSAGTDVAMSMMAFDAAAQAIGWAILFDGLDGRIARLTNSSSDFGREFDSLADVITFGVAPAFLAYAWGIRMVEVSSATQSIHHLRQAGWIITFMFVICGAARLARFNIDSTKLSGDRRHFIGLPIPAAAGVIAAIVHWAKMPVTEWTIAAVWLGIIGTVALLMVSRVRYFSFKTIDLRRRRPYVMIIVIGAIVWAIWAFSEYVLLTLALTYGLSGPLARILSRIRPQSPAPEEVHAS